MKYSIVIFSFLISLVIISCDNTEITDQQKNSFIKFYGNLAKDEGVRVIQLEDKGYLILGVMSNPGTNKDICLIQTDEFGNSTAPIKTFGGPFNDIAYNFKKTDNGYLIVGKSEVSSLGNEDVLIISLDKKVEQVGNTITYGSLSDDAAYDILQLANGNFVVTGYTDSLSQTKKREILLAEFEPNGTPVLFKPFGYKENDEEGFSIVESMDTYLICGYTKSLPKGTTIRNIFVAKIDKSGNNFIPKHHDFNRNSEAVSIILKDDNTCLLTCNVQGESTNQAYIQLMEIDEDLNANWINWEETLNEGSFSKASYTAYFNENIFISGTSGESNIKGNILLIKTDNTGKNTENIIFGDGLSYTGSGFDFTNDGGYIFTGANFTNENSVICLVKLDTSGNF